MREELRFSIMMDAFRGKIILTLLFCAFLAGCSNHSVEGVNPMAVRALSGSDEQSVEFIFGRVDG